MFVLVPNHSIFSADGATLVLESAEADLLAALERAGVSAVLAAFADSSANSSLQGRLEAKRVSFRRLNHLEPRGSLGAKVSNYLSAAVRLPSIVQRADFTYIFCPGHCALLAGLSCIVLGRRFGLYVRGTWLDDAGRTSLAWRSVFRRADFLIVTGEAFRRRLLEFNDRVENEVPLTQMTVIDAAVEHDRRSTRIQSLLFVGRLSADKGILDLIEALALLRDRHGLRLELRIAGGGTPQELRDVEECIERNSLRGAVALLGHVGNPADLERQYRAADAFVFPSYFREGLPRVLYEAMMCALPIITTRMPGLEGFLVDGTNATYCRERDPADLARCIARLAAEPTAAAEMGARAQAEVRRVFASFRHRTHAEQLLEQLRRYGVICPA